ncbi:glutathione S-transferase family protein [Pseudohaliea sp.]|uniref:glutathione S-transferase family protein n=1 Tax=Pseudohaliea sp. TaxID=2740289 RepID=UPI0032ED0C74
MDAKALTIQAEGAARAGAIPTELTLYHASYSTCSQKVRLCLAEKGLQYRSHLMHLGSGENHSPDYLRLNPNGVLPTLLDGGNPIVDSSVICEYLDETFPAPKLGPTSALERASMRSWMRYFEEVPTTAIRIPSINKLFLASIRSMGAGWQQMVEASPLRRELYAQLDEEGFSEQTMREAIRQLDECCRRVDAALSSRGWLVGDSLSIADIVLLPTIVRMDDIGLLTHIGNLPSLRAWYTALCGRDSFRRCYFPGSRQRPSARF